MSTKTAAQILLSAPVFALVFALAGGPVAAAELSARQIIDLVADTHQQPFEYEEQELVLIDKAGNKEKREMRRYAREDGKGNFKYLVVFRAPAGVKGVALLTWQNKGKADDQWLYLPAMGRKMKRIAKGGRKNYFMGTDYTFEDLISASRDDFTYELEADQEVGGKANYVIKVTPKDKAAAKKSGYKHRLVFVQKDIMFISRTDYFNKRGKFIKRQTLGELENVGGKAWRANLARMENKKENHVTEVRLIKRSLNEKSVPKKNFKQRFITSGKHLR